MPDRRRYNQIVVAATHNSFAGKPSGDLGSISRQLDRGVRFVELDVHDNDFAHFGYRIGHESPGDGVVHGGGNPAGDRLPDWLQTIVNWSGNHAGHVPIAVLLDVKDPLTDNRSFAAGNLGRLNAEIVGHIPRLFTAEELAVAAWPSVDALRDRVIVVLSGDAGNRRAYVRDPGHNPAVAVDAAGRIVEVHDSGDGDLWYWTGEFISATEVRWHRHGWYDTGRLPAVALNSAGRVVEVHQAPSGDRLWYRVGRLAANYELEWTASGGRSFPDEDEGRNPSVRFVNAGTTSVREIHQSPSTGNRWYWNGTMSGRAIAWTRDDSGQTQDPLFNKSHDSAGGHAISVRTGSNGAFGRDTLLFSAGSTRSQRIRYRQLAFVEVQRGDDDLAQEGAWFFAAPAGDAGARNWAQGWRRGGKLVRLWQFNASHFGTDPPPSYPATDHPDAGWYVDYCAAVGAIS